MVDTLADRALNVISLNRFDFRSGRINVDSAVIALIGRPNLLSASSGEVA
jgi:hypothetical protein